MPRFKTHISQAFWCALERNISKFRPATFSFGDDDSPRSISWFDELLEGGIELAENDNLKEQFEAESLKTMPLTFLIAGPPGIGKTTFALELCYRMAMHENKNSLFISTELETNRIVSNATFKYSQADLYISGIAENRADYPSVTVWGKERFEKWQNIYELINRALTEVGTSLLAASPSQSAGWILNRIRYNAQTNCIDSFSPDILVIDSLNIIDPDEISDFFQKLLKTIYGGSGILVCSLDDTSPDKLFNSWSHVFDIVIYLNYIRNKDYYLRTIEIVKTRFQPHVWGKHQFKIYPKYTGLLEDEKVLKLKSDERIEYNRKLRRAHPFREEGGIFIYPSVHYYLSAYKRGANEKKPSLIDTLPEKLNNVIKISQGRCSAFIGCRGAYKSHLAFLHLIYRVHKFRESGLIVSLRDDEEMTKRTINKILWREFREKEILDEKQRFQETDEELKKNLDDNMKFLDDYIKSERLEILYFDPGYITPEEFFHRVFMSVQRLKQSKKPLTVLFNSLDQLSARFPLCAKQELFIPTIVTALTGENVTSIFIAVEEPGQPIELYGVLPLADLILSFHQHVFKGKDYFGHIASKIGFKDFSEKLDELADEIYGEKYSEKIDRIKIELERTELVAIVLQVMKYAGGRRAGARGLFELVHKKEIQNSLYPIAGLHFTSLSTKYSHGTPIGSHRFPRG